jgi:tetratricopeptide (TPR) repeat protein
MKGTSSFTKQEAGFNFLFQMASCLVLATGLFVVLSQLFFPSERVSSANRVNAAIAANKPDAIAVAQQHLTLFPDDPPILIASAELAAEEHNQALAIEYYKKLPIDGGMWQLQRELGLAKRSRVLGNMLDEERHLRGVLQLDPTHSDANHRLGHLLQVQGRTWESAEPFMMKIRRGKCSGDELMGVATTERFFRQDDDFERKAICVNADLPGIAILATARRMLFENRNDLAEQQLRQVVQVTPHLGEAQGRLGRIIVERGDLSEFLLWLGNLPETALQHPEVLFVQGLQSRRIGQMEGAIYCLRKAIQLSPNHLPANVQIAACLESIGESKAAAYFQRRAALLSELEAILNLMRSESDEHMIVKAVDRLGQLGRYWEAAGWLNLMPQLGFEDNSARQMLGYYAHLAVQNSDQNAAFVSEIAAFNLDRFGEPNWGLESKGEYSSNNDRSSLQHMAVDWQMNDEAKAAGIDFTYFEGTTEETRLQHIFNVVGGGMAVIDYDLDSWPDLHITQANDWRVQNSEPATLDSLYRNINGVKFKDVAMMANLIEPGFSHGVCAADFDQDGFPDLYVSNLGANRLFRNNGDGTFLDVSAAANVAGNEWSVTSVLADFSGDGLPDLYVGNYSKLHETSIKECRRSTGELMACTPDVLPAESDRLYLNLGDGRFTDITVESNIHETSGRALALIAWDFTGSGRTSLFVANDTSANFLFNNIETNSNGIPQFNEEGILRGVAFDADGNAQASMGVAAGDANGDGHIDLFVTNFENESNTFYSQGVDGLFLDLTRQYNLRDAGFGMLGFGTQFIDVDGDGWDDLVAANGHVDKRRNSDEHDRMQPQLFRNVDGKEFVEIPNDLLGAFFQNEYLGRGLATLDWNKDRNMDFAVSNLHAPFSLISNRTPATGQTFVVRLVSKFGVRDGSGSSIRVQIGGRNHYRFAVAGGGYLTTNQLEYVFCVPPSKTIDELEVIWHGGKSQRWNDVVAAGEIALIEDNPECLPIEYHWLE